MWTLPIQTDETHTLAAIQRVDDDPGHIMVVDDSREVACALAALLELFSHTVELVNEGNAALNAIAGQPPDLVILDVRLPDVDGYTICATLKRNPETWRIHLSLGDRYRELGWFDQAEDEYLATLELVPGEDRARQGLAQVRRSRAREPLR